MNPNRLVEIIRPILKNKSRMFSTSITSSTEEDIESQLWVHVFENMPKFDNLEESDIRSLASTILINKARSLYRRHRTVLKYTVDIPSESASGSVDDIAVAEAGMLGMKIFGKGRHMYDQHSSIEYKELMEVIKSWTSHQDAITQRLVSEMINPSNSTLDKWYEMVEKHPVYKTYGYIPPCSYHKILGISRPKIIKVMKALRQHLESVYLGNVEAICCS